MSDHRIRALRAFGWQLDYRPDGWLPLGIRGELGLSWSGPRWHVLRLGPFGCVTLRRLHPLPPVTADITIDSTQFLSTLEAARDAGLQLAADFERLRWQNTIRGERTKAKRWWGEHITAAYATYGWEWPGPPPGSPWSRQHQVRVSLVPNVADPNAPTRAELEDAVEIGDLVMDVRPTRRNP